MNRPAELPLSTAVLCTWTGQPCSIAPALVELVNVASNIAGCQHIIYGWAVRQSGNLEPDLKTLDLTLAGATSIPSTSMLDLAVWQVEYDRQLAQVLPQRRNAIPLDESPGHLLARMAWAMAQISAHTEKYGRQTGAPVLGLANLEHDAAAYDQAINDLAEGRRQVWPIIEPSRT